MLDFEDIKSRVTIRDILEDQGYHPRKNRMQCPIHDGDNPTSFLFTNQVFYCHSCAASGGLIDLTEALLGLNRSDALKYLAKLAGISNYEYYSSNIQNRISSRQQNPKRIIDAKLSNLEGALKELEILRDQYTCQIRNARKLFNNGKLDLPHYYAIIQYPDYVLVELDAEVNETIYGINYRRRELLKADKG